MTPPFVPSDFEVPRDVDGPGFRLEPLGPEHNERDHAAWMSSIDHILNTPGMDAWEAQWPVPMSLEANRNDLVRHREEFENREEFAYSILDDEDVVGCLYIDPTKQPDYDAHVLSWVTASRADLDVVVWRFVSDWLAEDWPFERVLYSSRD
jgi:hypothetical protein